MLSGKNTLFKKTGKKEKNDAPGTRTLNLSLRRTTRYHCDSAPMLSQPLVAGLLSYCIMSYMKGVSRPTPFF